MSFKELPAVEMTAPEIFAANQKANVTVPIRRIAKNAGASSASAPTADASAFATDVAAPAPSTLKTSANLGAQPVARRKWGELWLPLALATLVVAGLGGGWLYAWAKSLADSSVFVALAVIGFGVGLGCWPAIRLGKCRSVVGAGALAALTCALVYLSMLGWSGLQMRAQAINSFAPVVAKTKGISLQAARQNLAARLSPQRAIALHLQELNTYGITVTDSNKSRVAGSSGGGTHYTGLGFWAFFAFQLGLSALVAGGLATSFAKAPFHEGTGTWYRKFAAYALHPAHVAPLLELCSQGHWAEAGRLAKDSKTGGKVGATATVYHLPGQDGFVRVSSSQQSGSKVLFEKTLDQNEVGLWKPK